jgi:hypothetical protein
MVTVEISGLDELNTRLQQVKAIKENPGAVMRTVALAVLPELLYRVHTQGQDAKGEQIGTYSPGYMKVRTGNFSDGAKYKRGEKAGKDKEQKKAGDAGTFSRGANAGKPRPVYNRTADTKVIISLTRQTENGAGVFETENGYGIGYANQDNYNKVIWCENTYGKKILTDLTDREKELAFTTAAQFTTDYLK